MTKGTHEARRQRGLDVLRTLSGSDNVEAQAQRLEDTNGPLGSFIVDFALGDIWSRPGLSRRDRSLVVISVLAALNQTRQLKAHVRGAINHGMTAVEVREVMTHMCGYAGFPRAIDAMQVANEVLSDMGHAPKGGALQPAERLSDEERWTRGAEGLSAITGASIPATRPADTGNGPVGLGPLGGIAVDFCFGDIWSRTELIHRDRSVLVVSVLAALGRTDELKIHIPAAIKNGVTVDELEEMIVTYAAYAGFPFAVECRNVLSKHLKSTSKDLSGDKTPKN
ncbi:MAG: carboxymuconolactone decarboxylase family protein [Pseudomonadales bacterium]|nr:carboxymuconolactone decarboxylase family protein [Pseudomonadales bacterium]